MTEEKNTTQKKKVDTVRQRKTTATASTQRYLPISEIKNNSIVLKNGGIRAVLQTSSVNFNLKSEEEQNSLIYAYQSFLNTLDFPVQILIRSKKLDIDNYIENLKEIAENQTQPLLQKQTEEYTEYISKLVEYADIDAGPKLGFIEKFWEHLHPQDTLSKLLARQRDFQTRRKILTQRVNIVKQGLENCNLRVAELNTQEIISLMYQVYNPITSREQKTDKLDKTQIQKDQE